MYKLTFDSDGLIVQTNGDGGDCAARSGTLVMGLKLRELMGIDNSEWPVTAKDYWATVKNRLFIVDTVLRYDKAPYSDPYDVPGDQVMPIVMSAILMGDQKVADIILKRIKLNYYRFPNGDLCGPQDLIVWNEHHFLGSIQLFGAVVVRCYQGRDPDNVGDDIRLTETLAFLNYIPARDLYGRRRPGGVQKAWDHYFRPETNANPLNELWRPIIEKLF